jgi:hypothetical protein
VLGPTQRGQQLLWTPLCQQAKNRRSHSGSLYSLATAVDGVTLALQIKTLRDQKGHSLAGLGLGSGMELRAGLNISGHSEERQFLEGDFREQSISLCFLAWENMCLGTGELPGYRTGRLGKSGQLCKHTQSSHSTTSPASETPPDGKEIFELHMMRIGSSDLCLY